MCKRSVKSVFSLINFDVKICTRYLEPTRKWYEVIFSCLGCFNFIWILFHSLVRFFSVQLPVKQLPKSWRKLTSSSIHMQTMPLIWLSKYTHSASSIFVVVLSYTLRFAPFRKCIFFFFSNLFLFWFICLDMLIYLLWTAQKELSHCAQIWKLTIQMWGCYCLLGESFFLSLCYLKLNILF